MRTPAPLPRQSHPAPATRSRRLARRLLLVGAALAALWLTACEDVPGTEVTVTVNNGVGVVAGTDQPDLIVLRLRAGDPGTIDVDIDLDGEGELEIDRAAVHTLALKGYGGDDALVIDSSNGGFTDTERTLMAGGAGADTLIGGNGADWLAGGPGDDIVAGAQGADTLIGDDGDDRFAWNPGDSSDEVTGGIGADRLEFKGDESAEAFDVSPIGDGRARVARSVANVELDVDGVETVDLRARGGDDTVYVTDLADTGVESIGVDLASADGGDDGHVDAVAVGSADVAIGRDGNAATVTGLGAHLRVINGAANDEIRVAGSAPDEVVEIDGTTAADQVAVQSAGTDVVVAGATPGLFVRLAGIEELDVDLDNGADLFSAVGNLAALTHLDVDGGGGSDTLLGSNGADVLSGGAGHDTIDGQQGDDTLVGVGGDDVFRWDPGDGSDTYIGSGGSDRFVMNGSGANENYTVGPVDGGHVRVTRDIGNIVHDLNEIEALELNLLAGADTASLADVSGTHLSTVTPNLAVAGGGDDGQQDSIVVPPGKPIGRDGTGVPAIGGLGAQVRVVGGTTADRVRLIGTAGADVAPVLGTDTVDEIAIIASGTDAVVYPDLAGPHVSLFQVETLDVDALGGDDLVTAVGNLAALTSIDVDAGEGADTVIGGNGSDRLDGGPGEDTIDGNQGNDDLAGGDGDDVFQWDPGDGSDVMSGDVGADRFVMNGSGANEIYGLSALPDGRTRFTRNLANIVHAFAKVETVDVRSLGGADTLHVADLSTTDVTNVINDLAVGGGDDGQVDSVAFAPGVTVRSDGTAAIVDGVGPVVRVVGGSVSDRIHVIGGGSATDVVTVLGSEGADTVDSFADNTDVAIYGATPGLHVRLTAMTTALVDLGNGPDLFTATGNLAALVTLDVRGGSGDDGLYGSNGSDRLDGGPGGDTIDGNQGNDSIDAGEGTDVVQWDPGDGSDTIVGGTGFDRLLFNGSAASEIYSVAPAGGGHVTLTRNVANIVLDLHQMDRVDLLTRDGTDQVTVDPLAGTTLSELVVDLGSTPGGGPDTFGDLVTCNGSAGDDNLLVFDDATDVVVQGGQPTVRIAGASPLDGLLVQGLAGDDVIDATPGAHALMALTLLP